MLSLLVLSQASVANTQDSLEIPGELLPIFNNFNPELVPVRENPGSNAERVSQVLHEKSFLVSGENLSIKWTKLGYGNITEKVIVHELANHSMFNHRNDGEEGPCLRTYRLPGSEGIKIDANTDYEVNIQVSNLYRINREKKICQVFMVEDVELEIGNVKFVHQNRKDMGFRFIGDCNGTPVK